MPAITIGAICCIDLWKGKVSELAYNWANRLDGLVPGWVKPAEVAWYADHRHYPDAGNEIWEYCYIYKYGFDVPTGATSVTQPNNPSVRVFAMSTANGVRDEATAARPLFDTLADHNHDGVPRIVEEPTTPDGMRVRIDPPLYWQTGHLHYTEDGQDRTPTSARTRGRSR